MAQNLPRGTPGRVLVLLTLLCGLVAVSAWRDALRRETDAWVSHPTALRDREVLLPGQLPARLVRGGKALSLSAGGAVMKRRDDRMFRVAPGEGAGLPFSLFTAQENLEAEAEPKIYARTGPGQFLRLRVRVAADQGGAAAAVVPGASSTGAAAGVEGSEEAPFGEEAPAGGTL